ncbi:unnamed protein product [Heterobilharzia americana]|nr:unnamed protein product [Heterobilharzia americana]
MYAQRLKLASCQGCPDCKRDEEIWHRSARNLRKQVEWKSTLQNCQLERRFNYLFPYRHPDDNHEHTEFSSGYHDVPNSIEGSHTVGISLLMQDQDHDSKMDSTRGEGKSQ